MVYLETGSDATPRRLEAMRKISKAIRPRAEALTLLLGDFNFVTSDRDRWCKPQGQWSRDGDRNEQQDFHRLLEEPPCLHELSQPHYTCDMGTARSRIDSLYNNHDGPTRLALLLRSYALDILVGYRMVLHMLAGSHSSSVLRVGVAMLTKPCLR